ncbi:MAG: hypothetical protein K2M06_03355 [Muribaculaceae bacterium]|nr:hypothetical protein [Muribaculaceae bacterium]
MKQRFKGLLASAALIVAVAGCCLLSSCSKKAPSALVPLVDKLNLDLAAQAKNNPMFLSDASASIDSLTSDISVKVEFCDSIIDVEKLSEALVEYYTAMQLKANPGQSLDTFLNTLSAEEGKMSLELKDVYGHSRTYEMSGTRLKQLFRSAPMQLGFNDVKANVIEILAMRCPEYRKAANALDCTLDIESGFATYTLTFARESNYANLNQGSLKGRYLHFLQPTYENFESFRQPIEELLQSLQLDGYRFVYATEDGKGKELRVAIPWRDI